MRRILANEGRRRRRIGLSKAEPGKREQQQEQPSLHEAGPSVKRKTLREPCAVVEQALESFAEQEVPAVFFGLGKEGQQNIAQLSGDVVCSEQLQSVGEIDHLGDRWRFFERVIAERERDPGHLPMETSHRPSACGWR